MSNGTSSDRDSQRGGPNPDEPKPSGGVIEPPQLAAIAAAAAVGGLIGGFVGALIGAG